MFNQAPVTFKTDNMMEDDDSGMDSKGSCNSRRPPNAFILYSQAMRSQAREENPSLTNTEVSRVLGKMWKEVPNEIKIQYKQKAAAMQESFKRDHPDYTYSKARRKRAMTELLTKSQPEFMVPQYAQFLYDTNAVQNQQYQYMNQMQGQQFPTMSGMSQQHQGQGMYQVAQPNQQMQNMYGQLGQPLQSLNFDFSSYQLGGGQMSQPAQHRSDNMFNQNIGQFHMKQ